jgi:hypothetical protein
MYCYVCALAQQATPAVAICEICSVGLCMEHHAENKQRRGPGGMSAYACLHRLSGPSGGHRVKKPRRSADTLKRVRRVAAERRRLWVPGLRSRPAPTALTRDRP